MKSKGNWILNRKGLIIICRILKNIWIFGSWDHAQN